MSDQATEGKRSGRRGLWAVAAAGLVVVAGVSYLALDEETEAERFCTADGRVGPNGDLHRDPDQDCAWVDEDGNLVPDL